MKIAEKNGFFSISFGAMDSARNENGTQGKARNKGLSVFAGDLRQNTETAIERKRKEIREKAVKVIQSGRKISRKAKREFREPGIP